MVFSKFSLKWRLALGIGVLGALASMLLSQFASRLGHDQVERDQSALMQSLAERMTAQLAHDMSTRAGEILFLADGDRIRDPKLSAEKKREIFERSKRAYPFYAWIGMTDAAGTVVAGTDGLLVGKSVAQRDWFLRGREGLHFGDAHDAFLLAKLLPKPRWDDLPLRLVDVSAPVHDERGNLVGVVCGHLSLDWAFEAREAMLDRIAGQQLDLVVLNREGKVLMGTPTLPSLKVSLAGLAAWRGLGGPGGVERQAAVEAWPDGRSYLTAAVREAPFRNYPGMGWSVVVRQPEDVAFAPADRLSRTILVGGLAASLGFAAILWLMLSRSLRPLEQISEAARRVRDEDLSTPIPQPQGEGELAVFARSLTGLVGTLQARNAELRLAGRVFDESGQGILIADAGNRIVRVNHAFSRITGYAESEVAGRTPSVLRSGMQGADYYRAMWQSIASTGAWQGEIWNRTKAGHIYPEWLTINTLRNEAGAVTHYIGIFDDITDKKNYETRLVHLASYDVLTDLPNRHLLQQQVGSAIADAERTGANVALIFVDLDKFKHINDTLGHPAGDRVLQEVADRFRAMAGDSGILARWGGDEFVVALPEADGPRAAAVAARLIACLEQPFRIDEGQYHLTLSAGIALYPADGRTVDALLRCADTAMYQAKREGANRCRFYERSMNAGIEDFLKIDNALRQSLDHGGLGLGLAFQLQFAADGTSVVGAEVLARWTHTELGAVEPGRFIPVAEETGQIVPLGRWVIEEAALSYAAIRAASGRALPLSMNLSAHQLSDEGLLPALASACERHAVPPADIVIEVTESAIMSDEACVLDSLKALKAAGFRVSIDDFGTGYACLNYIQKVHPAEIKVDRSFVGAMLADPDSHIIVAFTVGLARSMAVDVVAEGVETEAQLDALRELGPVRLQGFLLARPMPLAQLVARLRADGAEAPAAAATGTPG